MSRSDVSAVMKQAQGQWPYILDSLNITVNHKHSPCPVCGGKDRFRFDNLDGRGTWICNRCGAGDGLELVKRVLRCDTLNAVKHVSVLLNGEFFESIKKMPKVFWVSPRAHDFVDITKRVENIADKVSRLLSKTELKEPPYLLMKGLSEYRYLVLPDGKLVLTLVDINSTIQGAQVIAPDGKKRLLAGSQAKGAFIPLSDACRDSNRIILTEGFATALSVSLLNSGCYVVSTISSGNLIHVATAFRNKYPDKQIIIAADNDISDTGKNTGKEAAEKAALSINALVTLPPTDYKADWDDYRQQFGIDKAKEAFNNALYFPAKPTFEKRNKTVHAGTSLSQMAASQRGKILAEHYGDIAVNPDSETVYTFNGSVWQKQTDNELRRTMGSIFDNHDTPYSPKGIDATIEAMKLQIPLIGKQRRELIGFENGVYDLATSQFIPHCPDNWLMNHNGIMFTQPEINENLPDHAPNFYKWLTHSAGNKARKAERINAALFMILANRYDWQLFIEVTGEGGSGKSIFTAIAAILAGEHNTASGNMAALDNARGRAQFVGKSLITLPDQTKYVGEGAGIKAITGGDLVEIDGKYEKQFSTILHGVILATNNEPMMFTELNGGIARRRVIFSFNNPVSDKDKDANLMAKIRCEMPVVIRHLLTIFSDQNKAKQLLIEQRESTEALEVKRGTDPVIDLCASLNFMAEPKGLMMGGGSFIKQEPRAYLYHLYLAFLEYHGLGKPLSVEKFSRALKNAAKEHKRTYLTRKIKGRTQTNIKLTELADEFIPYALGIELPE